MLNTRYSILNTPISILPLVSFRILFGLLALAGLLWSVAKGEIEGRYIAANFYFKYYGFEWVAYPGDTGIVLLYILAAFGAIGIILGAFYRISVAVFAMSFSYLHTVDASNFINHYYLIWIFALYLFFVPANANFSLDLRWNRVVARGEIPRFMLLLFQLQIGIVYTCAGIAKLNPDWIFRAMPLKIWLGQQLDYPILGPLFGLNELHYGMSWFGAAYDLSIFWFLLWQRSRPFAYVAVLVFHLLTASLFDIGLFPPLMIIACTLFFSPAWHLRLLSYLGYKENITQNAVFEINKQKILLLSCATFLLIQIFLPFRHLLFTNENILWTQDYYRYGWRVMLVENEGFATFTVRDRKSEQFWEIDNKAFLTDYQIKRMSVQPEHIRQFAHYLAAVYAKKYGLDKPIVSADVHVTLNGRISRRLIRPDVDLAQVRDSWSKKDWILRD